MMRSLIEVIIDVPIRKLFITRSSSVLSCRQIFTGLMAVLSTININHNKTRDYFMITQLQLVKILNVLAYINIKPKNSKNQYSMTTFLLICNIQKFKYIKKKSPLIIWALMQRIDMLNYSIALLQNTITKLIVGTLLHILTFRINVTNFQRSWVCFW